MGTIDYVSNARAQHFESTANCCGNSVVYELPSDATGITMHADAIAGRQIFRKFYSRVSEILGCQSFTVSGTTLFPDYDKYSGNFIRGFLRYWAVNHLLFLERPYFQIMTIIWVILVMSVENDA